jgi:hypothetical protein
VVWLLDIFKKEFCEAASLLRLGGNAAGALGSAGLEAVLESARDVLEVAAAAGADGLSSLGLLAPVVCWELAFLALREVLARGLSRSSNRGLLAWDGLMGRTLAGLGGRVAARRALMLLDVHGATS